MKPNVTFPDDFKYDYWILHQQLVLDEIVTIFHKITHISFNIGPGILNVHTLGHPFLSAGHRYGTATFSNLQQKYFKENPLVAIFRDGNESLFSLT